MRQIRLRRLRRRLGLYQPPTPTLKAMDPASVRQRRRVFETLPDYPECPEGWHTGAPDFVIFGAQKSGTTWWFRLIEQHPDVVQPVNQRPELHFFDRLWAEWPDDEAIASYHRYFPRPAGKLVGEKTPEYLSCPWAPPMVKLAAPDTKVIVLLRDPVERYISGMSHMDRGGLLDESEAEGVVRVLGDRMRVVSDAISRGLYAGQLQWLLESYPAEKVLVLPYEACAADAAGQLSRTFEFLGLAPFQLPAEELARARNKAKLEKVAVPDEHIELLRRYYRSDVEQLHSMMPELDLSLWPHFKELA
jgi:Sulfotransferase domain